MNLVKHNTEIENLELVIDQDTGACFASRNALARMCEVDPATITRWKGSAQIVTIAAQIQTEGGLQGSALFNEHAVFEAFAKYNPNLLVQCAKAGLRVYLHGLAGYNYEVKPKEVFPVVPVVRDSYLELAQAADIVDNLADPLLKSVLSQYMCETLGNNSLAPAKQSQLTVRAEQLGISQSLVLKNRLKLGQYVRRYFDPVGKTQSGKYPVNVYEVTPELDQAIMDYFEALDGLTLVS